MSQNNHFSQKVSDFHGREIPRGNMTLVGYSALIGEFELKVPLPSTLSLIGSKHQKLVYPGWIIN